MVAMVHAQLDLENLSALGLLTTALHHMTIYGAVCDHHTALMPAVRTLRLKGDLRAADFRFLMHLHQLQELHMSARADWYRGSCPTFPASLRVLDVSACNVGQLPSLPNLEELNVSMSTNLSAAIIPALPKLRVLNMSFSALKQAAKLDFRHLTELHTLDVSACRIQEPILVGPQLRSLNVHACHYLVGLPDMPNLLELNVRACWNLVAFPQLPSLTKLDMTMCPAPLNESMRELQELRMSQDHTMPAYHFTPKLRVLECGSSLHLERLHDLTSLTLHVQRWTDFKCFLPTSHQLQILDLCGCVKDSHLAYLTHFPNLTSLAVRSARITDDGMQHIAELQGLELLSLERIFDLRITRAAFLRLSALKNLRHLKLVTCGIEEPIEAVAYIKSLESLYIASNGYVLRLEQLQGLYNLTRLEIKHCYVLSLRGLNRLRRLDNLTIIECVGLTCEGWFELLPCALTTLTVSCNDRRLLGNRWGQFVNGLRASSPWVEVVQQRIAG